MYAIDKKSGRTRWTLGLPGQPCTAPGVDEKQVYVGTLDGSVYAFSLRKIQQLFEEQLLPKYSHETMVWRATTSKEITSPPIPFGRSVSYGSRDGSLYSVSTINRQLIYQVETNAPIVAPVVSTGKVQYLASEDFTFFALNANNGRILWEFTSGLPIRKSPYVVGNDLYLTPDRGGMYCLEADEGVQRWWQPNLNSFQAVIGDAMFASDQEGNLVRVARSSGAIAGSLPLRAYTIRVSNDRTDRIFMSTPNGIVIAMRKRGETIPVFHKYPDRLPILPEVAPEPAGEDASASSASNN
jgi:outer membrane protein assembly factor BamB